MRNTLYAASACLATLLLLATHGWSAEDEPWIELNGKDGFAAWKNPDERWSEAKSVALDPDNPRRLSFQPGKGIIVNGQKGNAHDLLSQQLFGDIEAHLEFLIPEKSNSGVKFAGLYEIQIFDSWNAKKLTGGDCGGIYPRAELKPKYHHLDEGIAPRTNACRRPGEWQTLDIVFQTPRFDADGKKTVSAKFVKVLLNDKLIHENVTVTAPTGHAWHDKEVATGPLLLQADHGPVAFRNVRVRPYRGEKKP